MGGVEKEGGRVGKVMGAWEVIGVWRKRGRGAG
jgi:hypothetical protein